MPAGIDADDRPAVTPRVLVNTRSPVGLGKYGKKNVAEQREMQAEIGALRELVRRGQDAYVEALEYLIRATDGDVQSARDYLESIR